MQMRSVRNDKGELPRVSFRTKRILRRHYSELEAKREISEQSCWYLPHLSFRTQRIQDCRSLNSWRFLSSLLTTNYNQCKCAPFEMTRGNNPMRDTRLTVIVLFKSVTAKSIIIIRCQVNGGQQINDIISSQ